MKNRLFLTGMAFILSALLSGGCSVIRVAISEEATPVMVMRDEFTPPEDETASDPCDAPDAPTVHVPEELASIAAGVMEMGEHGRVVVAAGEYRENIEIRPGTHIIIQAEDSERPELFADDPESPVIRVAPEARLCLTGLSVHGSRSGLVVGSESTGEVSKAVTLRDTRVADAEYGIYGLVEEFHIEESVVENNDYGMAVAGSASLVNTTFAANITGVVLSGDSTPTCADAAYSDSGNSVLIQKVNVSNNQKGGIAICNVSSASVKDVYVHKNGYVGVQIHKTSKFSLNNLRVGETQLWNGGWGDGLVVEHSSGLVQNSQFSANKRANIFYYGNSGGKIENNLILYAVFSIVLDGKDGYNPSPTINNNYMYGNQKNSVSLGSNLGPVQPPKVPSL